VWWDVLLSLYYKFTAKSVGKRILNIGQYLAKLEAKVDTVYITIVCGFVVSG